MKTIFWLLLLKLLWRLKIDYAWHIIWVHSRWSVCAVCGVIFSLDLQLHGYKLMSTLITMITMIRDQIMSVSVSCHQFQYFVPLFRQIPHIYTWYAIYNLYQRQTTYICRHVCKIQYATMAIPSIWFGHISCHIWS